MPHLALSSGWKTTPGSPRPFALSLEPYRSHLSPGEYRFVFGLHASAQFFSYEFTLTAS